MTDSEKLQRIKVWIEVVEGYTRRLASMFQSQTSIVVAETMKDVLDTVTRIIDEAEE